MPLTVGIAQYPTQRTLSKSLTLLETVTRRAAATSTSLLLFPEAFLGSYPRGTTFGATIGSRTAAGRDEYYAYWSQCPDLGETHPEGLGEHTLPGDGTRQRLESIAAETGVFLVVGAVERQGGSLYCAVLFISPTDGLIAKRRKVMPTAAERIVWGVGSQKTLKAVPARIAGQDVVLGAAVCWENYMPLLRTSLYTQGVNIYLAPTADARESWIATMQHIALEGRCFVLGCNQFVTADTAVRFEGEDMVVDEEGEGVRVEGGIVRGDAQGGEVVCNGGSVVFGPEGELLAGPLWGEEGVLTVEVGEVVRRTVRAKMEFEGCGGGHYARYVDHDPGGGEGGEGLGGRSAEDVLMHGRSDVFKLEVEGLDLRDMRGSRG